MTGTNFERKGWQRLIADMKSGKVNCIIVKDFSRMGRNYIEVGNYMEKIFPFLGVRVVAVNDNFDSMKKVFQNDMLMNSLTNIVNEYYAKDISRKVIQARNAMQENGEYTSGTFPYGYMRSQENKRKMEIDLEAAPVVRKIFEWRVSGKSCTWIANSLNELAVPSPGLYRFMNGSQAFRTCRNAKWKSENISDIVTNPVYLGHTVQGKSYSSHFREDGKKKRLSREEWKVTENTHAPLTTKEKFEITMEMADCSRKKYIERISAHADIPRMENPLREKIYCAGCGRRMFRRSRVTNGARNYHFYCDARRRTLDGQCRQTYIREAPLMDAVREAVEKQMQLLGTLQEQRKRLGDSAGSSLERQNLAEKVKLEEEIRLIKKRKQGLYEELKNGMLEQEDFTGEWGKLTERQLQCESRIKNIGYASPAEIAEEGHFMEESHIAEGSHSMKQSHSMEAVHIMEESRSKVIEVMKQYLNSCFEGKSSDIPLDLLVILIEKIIVVSQQQIEIVYSYPDIVMKWCVEQQYRNCQETA